MNSLHHCVSQSEHGAPENPLQLRLSLCSNDSLDSTLPAEKLHHPQHRHH